MAGFSPPLRLDLTFKVTTEGGMSYLRKTTKAGPVIDVLEYHNGRYGAPGQKREKKRKATPEEMARANQRSKEKRIWLKILANFTDGDFYLTLTYERDKRPKDIEEAKADFSRFIRKIKTKYKKNGEELKWIRNIEKGSKGGWHVHAIMSAPKNNREDILKYIQNEWVALHGRVWCELMNRTIKPEDGPFRRLAEYVAKSGGVKAKNGSTPKEASFSASRNLVTPISKTVKRPYRTWRRKPRAPKGYHILERTLRQINNPLTGCPCREYVMVKDGYEGRIQSRLLC